MSFKLSVPAPLSGLFDLLAWSFILMRNLVESLLIIISGNPQKFILSRR